MNRTTITPTQAKHLGRELFLMRYPDHERWFELAWEVFQRELQPADVSSFERRARDLAVGDTSDPRVREMVKEFAMLFEAFMIRCPVVRDELCVRLKRSAQRRGRSDRATEELREALEALPAGVPNVLRESVESKESSMPANGSVALAGEALSISKDFTYITWWGQHFPCSQKQGQVVKALNDLRLEAGTKNSPATDWKAIKAKIPGETGYTSLPKVFHNDRQDIYSVLFGTLIVQKAHGKFYLDIKSPQAAKRAFSKSTGN